MGVGVSPTSGRPLGASSSRGELSFMTTRLTIGLPADRLLDGDGGPTRPRVGLRLACRNMGWGKAWVGMASWLSLFTSLPSRGDVAVTTLSSRVDAAKPPLHSREGPRDGGRACQFAQTALPCSTRSAEMHERGSPVILALHRPFKTVEIARGFPLAEVPNRWR